MAAIQECGITGIRPTLGGLHLGHLVGDVRPIVAASDVGILPFFILSDLSLNDSLEGKQSARPSRDAVYHILADAIASGANPERISFVIESDISINLLPLFILVLRSRTAPQLHRLPALKSTPLDAMNLATLTFPILQALQILAFGADQVYSNHDNKAMVEFAGDSVDKLNRCLDLSLSRPKLITGNPKLLPGTDGYKMSKAKKNCIFLGDSDLVIQKKVRKIVTDTARLHSTTPGETENNTLFRYIRAFITDADWVSNSTALYQKGAVGDAELKDHLAKKLIEIIGPIRTKSRELQTRPYYLEAVLVDGKKIAEARIASIIDRIFEA